MGPLQKENLVFHHFTGPMLWGVLALPWKSKSPSTWGFLLSRQVSNNLSTLKWQGDIVSNVIDPGSGKAHRSSDGDDRVPDVGKRSPW